MSLIELDFIDLIWALIMIGITIALSLWQGLGLEIKLVLAAGRTLFQLLAIGLLLDVIFTLNSPIYVLIIIAVMLTISAQIVRNRIGKRIKGLFPVVWGSIFVGCFVVVGYTIVLIIQPSIWYEPQYLIPLVGLVLASGMTSASLAGERLVNTIKNYRLEIETHLCLGATPLQAILAYKKEAIRVSLIPVLNQMMVVGFVSLPGIFTGQVLSGIPPIEAASYQILVLFMLVLSNLITVLLVTAGVYRRFFNDDFQLILP